MKNKYNLLKILIVLLVFVIAGVVYSCVSKAPDEQAEITDDYGEGSVRSTEATEPAAGEDISGPVSQKEAESVSQICVHVCGAVRDPGVYYLDAGSRVHQAVELAGGLTEDAADSYVNLADVVSDGEQIYIPTQSEAESAQMQHAPQDGTGTDGLVNINTADAAELATLPGIGQSRAEAIIAYRENVAPFSSVEDLQNVSGIGESVFDKIKDLIKV